ncbi:MAG: DUF433 domain-containing protein [Bacteroidia bacterium]|nr:DUF433 domain-containing protein [Bacteroidia bacterium]
MNSFLLSRITLDEAICHGKPTLRGSRLMVEAILELMASGMPHQELLDDYPGLEQDDLYACLWYAVELSRFSSSRMVAA